MNHLASITLLACCACVAGCMDEAAIAQRASANKIKSTVAAAQKALAGASGIDPQTNRSSAEAIRQVALSATATAGSLPSQKSAMALIAAQLQLQAAQLDAVVIEQLEQVQRLNADNIHLCASLHEQFQLLAKSADVGFPVEAREELQKDHTKSSMTATALTSSAEKLQAIVDEAQANIATYNSNALTLEKQSDELKKKAVAAGVIDGFQLTVDSQKALTESRKLLSESATIELNTQKSELEQRIASKTAQAYQASLNRNQVSMETIAQIELQRQTAVKDLSDVAQKYLASAIESATALRATSQKLNELYDGAMESLEKAVTLAQQAKSGSGEMAKSAKSAWLAAQLALASMAERRERMSTIEISAYTSAAKLNEDGSWSKDAAAAQSIRNACATKASEALEGALAEIPEVEPDATTPAANFRKSIALAKANFSGMKVVEPPATTEPATTEPATTEPTATEPATTEPATTEPAATEPATTEPATTEPATTEPATTEPATTEPATTEPATTEPATTEPPVTDPPATEPPATEPPVTSENP